MLVIFFRKSNQSIGSYFFSYKIHKHNLRIYAEYDTETGNFTHRQISTKGTHEFLYGCLEIRAKLSVYPGADALWFSSDVSQETGYSQEIDLLEDLSFPTNQFASNLHFWGASHGSLDSTQYNKDKVYTLPDSQGNLSDNYHIFTLEWDPDTIKYCVDGKAFFAYDIKNGLTTNEGKCVGADTFRQAVFTMMSTTMGASSYGPKWQEGDPERVELRVDYVRLYQCKSDKGYSREILK